MENIKEKVLAEIRNPQLYLEKILKYVEENVEDAFNIACRKKLSINQWKPNETFGNQINQKTVLLTVRMFDLWETALVDVLKEHLNNKFEGVTVEHAHDSKGDLVVKFPDNSEEVWEIKTTQGKNSFTGATHSASKYQDYILISYAIDKDKVLRLKEEGGNKDFITELAVFVWDNMEAKWMGEHSDNSSWTTLKIPIEIKNKRPEIIVVGSLVPKQKWCEIKRMNLRESTKQKKL